MLMVCYEHSWAYHITRCKNLGVAFCIFKYVLKELRNNLRLCIFFFTIVVLTSKLGIKVRALHMSSKNYGWDTPIIP